MLYPSRYIFVCLVMAACFAAEATAVPPAAPQVDPCKQFDTNAVIAAVKGGLGQSFVAKSNPGDRYKSENIALLKGRSVLVFDLTLDKSVVFVSKEKLAEFAAKEFVPKM